MNSTEIKPTDSPAIIPDDWKHLAISRYGWGYGDTVDKAVRVCRQNEPIDYGPKSRALPKFDIKVYRVHPETNVFGDGSWEYPQGNHPVLTETRNATIRKR